MRGSVAGRGSQGKRNHLKYRFEPIHSFSSKRSAMKRVLISGVVAGVSLFIWLSLIHLATPLAQVGIRSIHNEDEVMTSIKSNIQEPGFYMFPGAATAPNASKQERRAAMAKAMEKMKTSPTGILVVYPNGKEPLAPALMLVELLNDIVQGLLLAWLIWLSWETTMGGRVKIGFIVGIIASFVTNVSYWNWYGFPTNYTVASIFGEVMGYVVMGAVVAITLGERKLRATS